MTHFLTTEEYHYLITTLLDGIHGHATSSVRFSTGEREVPQPDSNKQSRISRLILGISNLSKFGIV
jgi:hypothetical protein